MKTCSGCKISLEISNFGINRSRKDGLQSLCRPCKSIWAANNRKKYPQKYSDKRKLQYLKNKEKESEYGYQYRLINKEKINKRMSQYRKENPEIKRKSEHKRRALKLNNGYEPYTEAQMLKKYGTDCYLCNSPIDMNAPRQVGKSGWENGLHIEHVIAISNGGPDTLANVRPAHGLCNLNKSNKEKYEKA